MAMGWMALILLVLLRTDLLSAWRTATPTDAPNRFVINIQPDQGEAFRARLAQAGIASYDWYPMIRGRLVEINERSVGPEQYQDERAKRLVDREFNLSHTAALPGHNQVVAGVWVPGQMDGLSIEEGIARTLGLKLGDRLRFDLAGLTVQGTVTSIRRVEWTSMRANFFVLFPRAQMPDVPMSYMTAYRSPDAPGLDRRLLAQFPNITQVDLSATLNQVQSVLTQVSQAVECLFLFALASGWVVLIAVVVLTREERARDQAVLRALGASRRVLSRLQSAELLGTGALAGGLAAVTALAVAWALAREVFDFAWALPWWVVPMGVAMGAAMAAGVGGWTLRAVSSEADSESTGGRVSAYDRVGGEGAVRALVDRFYDLMDLEPRYAELRAVHGTTLEQARDKLFWFLCGWLGGPQHYTERFGHPRLRMRHMPFAIGIKERDQWLACMRQAMTESQLDPVLVERLDQAFFQTADWMRNQHGA
jgi:putative ABC transport system permease protein